MIEENRLREIIREEINKYFSNKMLFEFYAYERSDFRDIVRQHLPQIIIHWCLIRYFRLVDIDNQCINHWKGEINNWLSYLSRLDIKKHIKDYNFKLKTIKQVWEDEELYNNMSSFIRCFKNKFKEENIDINTNDFKSVIEMCQTESNIIIDLISKANNFDAIEEYVHSL